ncbi:MAG TPA: hypothetical protein VJM12_11100 [Pyrinomonadaceae bacterium]|nr:hypothetical protein [Pyrinomonadaceae bacterium]
MVSGHLEESLRHEIESYIEGRLSSVKQEITELQGRLNEALSQLLDRQSDVLLDGSVSSSILEHLRAAHEEGVNLAATESTRAKASSDMAIVKAAVSDIGEQSEQAQVLKILVNRAASFAPRVAFFAIKNERAIGWRARGFEGTVGDSAIQQISVPVSADSIVGEVTRSKNTWSGGPHSHSEDHLILNRLGEDPPQRIVAIPMTVRNRPVAVLYADSAGLDSEAINLEALEILVRVSGMTVELLAAHAPAKEAPAPAPEAPRPEEPPAYVPEREYAEPAASPEPAAPYAAEPSQPYAAEPATPYAAEQPYTAEPSQPYATEPAQPYTAEPPPFVPEPPPAETVATLEAEKIEPRAFEALLPPAEAPAPPESVDAAVPRRRYGADVELPVSVDSEEERRLHNDARRFARLLVSEIKLYNEQKVIDGRQGHDLYDRLREYIDRSRDMYDKRVKPEVAQKYDYFHHELVSTLAEGDSSRLGNSYPGATVSA